MKCKCKKNCRKSESKLSFSYGKRHYRRSKYEADQSMCAAMKVFFH